MKNTINYFILFVVLTSFGLNYAETPPISPAPSDTNSKVDGSNKDAKGEATGRPGPEANSERIKEIYQVDEDVRNKEREVANLRSEAYKEEMNKHFDRASELKEKANKIEKEFIKDAKNKLEQLLKEYEGNWNKQSWWNQIAIEIGSPFTRFDRSLDIDDHFGVLVKLHWVKRGFRRFHLGSYLYYPLEISENYPLHQVEASPFFMEYRNYQTHTEIAGRKEDVEINSYRFGFGLSSQAFNNTYLTLNLAGGVERYTGTEPNDTGPVVSYTAGLSHRLSEHLGIGLELSESATWTRANKDTTETIFNFTANLLFRISF